MVRVVVSGFLIASLSVAATQSRAQGAPGDPASLDRLHNTALESQKAGQLDEAASNYRRFLAAALGELAMDYGLARDYGQAAPLFDEALNLEPNSPSLLLDYARAALTLGDVDHARTLTTEFIQTFPGDPQMLAQAHQILGRALLKLYRDQEARKELEAAVALDPDFPNAYDLAVACLDLDDEKCAVQLFGEIESSLGDTPEIHMAFGRAYGDSDFQPRAVKEFERALQENPRLPGAHYLLAATLLATGDDEAHVEAAEAALKKEMVISPRDGMTYAALGKIEATRNNYRAAEQYLRQATLLDPHSPDAYLYLGQLYFDTHRTAEAETSLRECIRLTTDVSRNRYQAQKAHFLLGRILMQKGQPDAAHAEMQISRDLANKTLSQDKSKLAGLMDTQGPADSPAAAPVAKAPDAAAVRKVEALRRHLKPAVADSFNNLGAIAATKSDYGTAVTYFERASEWDSSIDGLDYNWGRAAFAGSRFADAILPLSRYLKAHPNDNGARSVLAISLFMTDNYKDCIATVRAAPGQTDFAPEVDYVYAESLIMTGQTVSGMERLKALEKSHPEIPDVHRALAEALDNQGQRKQATEELQTAIQLKARDAESHYDLGKIELESGDTEAAIPELEAAIRLSPDSEKFHEQLARAYKAASRTDDEQKEIRTYNELRAAHAHVQINASPPQATTPEP
jgi:tetratricopeptide (TPR) repeat protein